MVKSVVNEIIQGIANKIALLYKDKGQYPIYTDRKLQNLEKPCFFIKVLNGEEKKEIGLKDRFYRGDVMRNTSLEEDLLSIVIIGYAMDEDTEVLNDMSDTLYELEYIELSDKSKIRADKLNHKIEDGILHFFIDYKLFIKKDINETTKMNDYNLSGEVKEDEEN